MTSGELVAVAITEVLLLIFALRVSSQAGRQAALGLSFSLTWTTVAVSVFTAIWVLNSSSCFIIRLAAKVDPYFIGFSIELVSLVSTCMMSATILASHHHRRPLGLEVPAWLWTSSVIQTFLLGLTLGSGVELWAHILRVAVLWILAVSTSVQRTSPQPVYDPRKPETFQSPRESPLCGASFQEISTFSWMDPVFLCGSEQQLKPEHIYDIPHDHCAEHSRNELLPAWNAKIQAGSRSGTLMRAMYSVWSKEFWFAGFYHLLEIPCIFLSPVLLNCLIKYYGDPQAPLHVGFAYTFGLTCGGFLSSFFSQHFQMKMSLLGLHAQGATGTLVFEKGLRLSQPAAQEHTAGKLASIMNVDCERLGFAAYFIHFIWSMPLIFVIAMYLIWSQLGVSSLAAVAVMLCLSPLNKKIAKMYMHYGTKISEKRDKRAEIFKEINQAVKFVKLLTWEEQACNLIETHREAELRQITGMKNVWILGQFLFVVVPLLLPAVGFLTYGLVSNITGKPLNTAEAFTSLAIFDVLYIPINLVPITAQFLAQMYVSMQRIEGLLLAEERQQGLIHDSPTAPVNPQRTDAGQFSQEILEENSTDRIDVGKVCLEDAEVRWHPVAEQNDEELDDDDVTLTSLAVVQIQQRRRMQREALSGVQEVDTQMSSATPPTLIVPSLQIPKGMLTMVVGRVGSGKSTLLAGLLNEAPLIKGSIQVVGSTCYCAQQPWIMHGTVKSNIVFNHHMDRSRYIDVIKGCALSRDICSFGKKDLEVIGERGITLSGGQKARVALARAVYAEKDVVLMDDVLSAVDAHVGTHLMKNVIRGDTGTKALLEGKTRVLVTHQTQWLSYADFVVVISEGRVVGSGSYNDLVGQGLVDTVGEVEGQSMQEEDEPDVEAVLNFEEDVGNSGNDDDDERETGQISFRLWKIYCVTLGKRVSVFALLTFLLAEFTSVLANLVLSDWTSEGSQRKPSTLASEKLSLELADSHLTSHLGFDMSAISSQRKLTQSLGHSLEGDVTWYFSAYSILLLLSSSFIMVRNFVMREASIRCSRNLHKRALWGLLRAPMAWHDTTPNGRKINRFTADLQQVDEELQFTFQDFGRNCCQLLTSLLVVCIVAPIVLLILAIAGIKYYYVQRLYRSTARELRRLASMARSPVTQRLDEALAGKATINAKHQTERFIRDNIQRLDCLLGRNLILMTAERWLAVRLNALTSIVIMGVGIYALIRRPSNAYEVSLLALTLKYALSMTGVLNGLIQCFIFVELSLIAMERVDTYAKLPSEAALSPEPGDLALPERGNWPINGTLEFDNVVMRYRPELTPALRGCSFKLLGGKSVGIVGRTGAGKTSLLAAVFRLRELDEGRILVDNVDIATLGLHELRGRLAIIPQDPVLFACPLRQNLDPWHEHTDEALKERLRDMKLGELLTNPDGLDMPIASDGGNLSVGQRQLLCLARALLRQTRIFFLDEATASIDKQTDEVIQDTLRSDANSRTITMVTIAHRLETVLSADFILTMDDGKVAEFGPTVALANDSSSKFSAFLTRAKITGDALQTALQHGRVLSPAALQHAGLSLQPDGQK